jgi:hypothetical protein
MNPPVAEAALEAQPFLPEAEASASRRDAPIFVSADGRRSRLLKRLGQTVAALTILWLAALLAGAVGLGRLPGVHLPQTGSQAGDTSPASAAGSPAAHRGSSSGFSSLGERGHAGGHSLRGSESGAGDSESRRALGGHGDFGPLPGHRGPSGEMPPGRGGTGHTGGSGSGGGTMTPGSPATPSNPTTTTSPGSSGSAPGTTHRDGATANPSPQATEHSHKWGSSGG